MNAYELAEQLKEYAGNNGYSHNDYADTMSWSANMLRQQADRMAELEECLNACYAVQKMQAEEVYKGNHRIEELQKDLKYFTDPCNPACKPSICDCYQARFAINNRTAKEK